MYKSFIHVERLDKDETEGILIGRCLITPKLDGTNAVVYWNPKTQSVNGGSRKRELSLDKDNGNFDHWLLSSDVEACHLRKFIEDNPHLILYGEWGVGKLGSIKDYDNIAKDKLWLFDCYDIVQDTYIGDDSWREMVKSYGLENYVVPILLDKINPTVDELMEIANNNDFLLSNANHPGEGIVIRNPSYRDKWGHYQVGKIVLDEYKQQKAKAKNKPQIEKLDVEYQIADKYITESELAKAKAKTAAYFGTEEFKKENKYIGFYLNTVWKDDIVEEMWDILKKFKNPTINFRKLQNMVNGIARNYLGL